LTQIDIFVKSGDDAKSFKITERMQNYIEKHYIEKDKADNTLIPLNLLLNNCWVIIFEFENFYGLASVRNISSMKKCFEVYGVYYAFIDENSLVKGKAYAELAFMLEDQHKAKDLANSPLCEVNGGKGITPVFSNKFVDKRRTLGKNLADSRKEDLKAAGFKEEEYKNAILYSKDGTTACFYFDSFEALDNAFTNDGTTVKS